MCVLCCRWQAKLRDVVTTLESPTLEQLHALMAGHAHKHKHQQQQLALAAPHASPSAAARAAGAGSGGRPGAGAGGGVLSQHDLDQMVLG